MKQVFHLLAGAPVFFLSANALKVERGCFP